MQASLRWHLTYWLIGPLRCCHGGKLRFLRIALTRRPKASTARFLDPGTCDCQSPSPHGRQLELDLAFDCDQALRIDTEDRVYYQVRDRWRADCRNAAAAGAAGAAGSRGAYLL